MEKKRFDNYLAGAILKKMISCGVYPLTMPNRSQFNHLEGVGIHVAAAARKYNLPQPTISRWAKNGYIRILGTEKNRLILNEKDVAFLIALYKLNPGSGVKTIKAYFQETK